MLELDGNPLEKIPEFVYDLPNLTILFIRNTKIRKSQNLKKKFKAILVPLNSSNYIILEIKTLDSYYLIVRLKCYLRRKFI